MSLFTLDQTTLFYWNLSNEYSKAKFAGPKAVEVWTVGVPQGLKPPSSKRSVSTPSLTRSNASLATTATRPPTSVASRTSSALTNGITITEDDEDGFMEKGAVSDCDETRGEEYEAKKKSPVKGGLRLTSQVSTYHCS